MAGSYTIPSGVNSVEDWAFESCTGLTSVTVPSSVVALGSYSFYDCTSLGGIYFAGDAPNVDLSELIWYDNTTVYYLPGTTGWDYSFGTAMTAQWYLPNPQILSGASFGVTANQFGFTISWATNISVVVEASTNLSSPVWLPVSTNTLSNGFFYFSDAQWTNFPGRFYRISSP
jgi:hypothetical protein